MTAPSSTTPAPTGRSTSSSRPAGIGLDDGNDNFVGSNPVTRGEAALYAFNMLQTTMVEYDQQNTIVVGDITINTTSSRKEVANTGDEGIEKDNKMQFAERYFTDLTKRPGTSDEFERPSTTWRLKSRDIGTYADEADVTYTASVELGDIYSDLGLTDGIDGSDVTYFVDGADKTKADWNNAMDIVRGSKKDVPNAGNGVLTEVFYDEDNDSVTITLVNTYVGEVNAVRNDSSTRDAYITVKGVDGYVTPTASLVTMSLRRRASIRTTSWLTPSLRRRRRSSPWSWPRLSPAL